MGPPVDEERIQRMMSDPNVQQSMNEALSNPDFVNMLIESNPMLRNVPNAREIITSPFMRQMMTNPQLMSQAMRMQRSMRGGETAFPAPGATDTTPGAPRSSDTTSGQGEDAQGLMAMANAMGGMGGANENLSQLAQILNSVGNPFGSRGSEPHDAQGTTQADGTAGDTRNATNQNNTNPFAALFPQQGQQGNVNSPFGAVSPEMMQQMAQLLGMGSQSSAPPAPPDTRPPEERYAEQLRQLNDMGFYDFDRNVAALRRSGGSVQGAIEHLLSAAD